MALMKLQTKFKNGLYLGLYRLTVTNKLFIDAKVCYHLLGRCFSYNFFTHSLPETTSLIFLLKNYTTTFQRLFQLKTIFSNYIIAAMLCHYSILRIIVLYIKLINASIIKFDDEEIIRNSRKPINLDVNNFDWQPVL